MIWTTNFSAYHKMTCKPYPGMSIANEMALLLLHLLKTHHFIIISRDLEEECNNEKKENNQLKLRYEKCTQELTNQKDELCEKDRHLDGITNEVKNYGKHLKEIMEELEEVKC